MTKKNKDQNNENEIPVNKAADGNEEILVLSKSEVDDMKDQLEKAQQKCDENMECWQRERADFINYKKRIDREQEIQQQNFKADIMKKYLVILDDLYLAMRNRPKPNESAEAWIDGIDLILHKFEKINENEGLVKVDSSDDEFDPNVHQAISHEDHPEIESGKIIEVLQNGYKLGDRVIRPALVRVAK
jgi:molecular chaperone GrpE